MLRRCREKCTLHMRMSPERLSWVSTGSTAAYFEIRQQAIIKKNYRESLHRRECASLAFSTFTSRLVGYAFTGGEEQRCVWCRRGVCLAVAWISLVIPFGRFQNVPWLRATRETVRD